MIKIERSVGAKKSVVMSIRDVSYCYDFARKILHAMNFEIYTGDFVCVLGPSGCGKSTLLSLLAGFLSPTTGEILMEGKRIIGADWRRGVVFQRPALYPWLNLEENIGFGLKMRSYEINKRRELVDEYLKMIGLEDFKRSKPYEVSGGMCQRAALARALVGEPKVVLMDEPLGALDALTRQNMRNLVRRTWMETANTIFLITHDVDEALSLGTRLFVMSKDPGQIEREFSLSFTYALYKDGNDEVCYTKSYEMCRKEIMSILCRE